jgi:hypothetical protein
MDPDMAGEELSQRAGSEDEGPPGKPSGRVAEVGWKGTTER